ncbi:AF4/FMR2 family member 4 [Cyclospora cayetanensis]|uniref:AF4/FMR2 family member 4 n=1 Tax=Cyclospora cayetanensis TaxID=88456 RepID=A0A6P6S0L7_9EIME|nr:AF4/FMR2 family member 4 [Cyclospora cayetanensis]
MAAPPTGSAGGAPYSAAERASERSLGRTSSPPVPSDDAEKASCIDSSDRSCTRKREASRSSAEEGPSSHQHSRRSHSSAAIASAGASGVQTQPSSEEIYCATVEPKDGSISSLCPQPPGTAAATSAAAAAATTGVGKNVSSQAFSLSFFDSQEQLLQHEQQQQQQQQLQQQQQQQSLQYQHFASVSSPPLQAVTSAAAAAAAAVANGSLDLPWDSSSSMCSKKSTLSITRYSVSGSVAALLAHCTGSDPKANRIEDALLLVIRLDNVQQQLPQRPQQEVQLHQEEPQHRELLNCMLRQKFVLLQVGGNFAKYLNVLLADGRPNASSSASSSSSRSSRVKDAFISSSRVPDGMLPFLPLLLLSHALVHSIAGVAAVWSQQMNQGFSLPVLLKGVAFRGFAAAEGLVASDPCTWISAACVACGKTAQRIFSSGNSGSTCCTVCGHEDLMLR